MKGNRIIYPEVAVNGQFWAGKSKKFKLPEKNRNFSKISMKRSIFFKNLPEKNRNSFVKLPEKIEICRKCAWKIDFLPASTTPQISNQIDATGRVKGRTREVGKLNGREEMV